MNMKLWLQTQLSAQPRKAMPILSFPSIQLTGITVRELVSSSGAQARGMAAIARRCDAAASVSMMDLSVEAECFGSTVLFSDDEIPTVTGAVVSSMEDAAHLPTPQVGDGRTGIYVEAIAKAKASISDRPVFAGVIGPYSLAGRLMDVSQIMVNSIVEPDMVHATLRKATDFLRSYIRAYKDAGADGVVIAEPAAGLLPPDVLTMGNVDPVSVLRNGTPETVRAATLDLLTRCAGHRNFLISSGCDIPPAAPWANLDAFFAAVAEFWQR